MANIIEEFTLDMADDHDISFSKANALIDLLLRYQKVVNTPKFSRQNIINGLATGIESSYSHIADLFRYTLDHSQAMTDEIESTEADKAVRSANNTMRKIRKLVSELSNFS